MNKQIIKIELCFPKTEQGKTKLNPIPKSSWPKKKVAVAFHTINIGGIIKYFRTENGAHNFLESIGYLYNYETGLYEKKRIGEQERDLGRDFEVYKPTK